MRILLITDNHTRTGGAENYFFDLKDRLKNISGLEVYSLGFGPKDANGADFVVFKGLQSKLAKLFFQLIIHPGMYFKLRRQLKKIQPDVIHIHNIKHYTVSLLRAVKHYPLVQTIHDYGVICPTAHNIHKDLQPCKTGMRLSCYWQHQVKYKPLAYLALTLAFLKTRKALKKTVKTFFAPSPLLVDYLKIKEFEPSYYIPPFINAPQAHSFDSIKPYHFLFAGNLGSHKGIDVLLEEFALAYQKEPHLTLTIAGKGQDEQRLREKAKALGLEQAIHFSGWQTHLDKDYAECAAVIFPSLWMEAFGLIISEAMSYARPVIGTNRGSPPWLIDDQQTGFLFDPLKKGDLAEKILMLAGNIRLITALGKNGETKLRRFIDNEKVLQQIIGVYRKIKRKYSKNGLN